MAAQTAWNILLNCMLLRNSGHQGCTDRPGYRSFYVSFHNRLLPPKVGRHNARRWCDEHRMKHTTPSAFKQRGMRLWVQPLEDQPFRC